jgi:putative NADPH-quinone reductase/1,4-dihydroxy-2-naphthoate octaprenyltransferase
MASDVRSPLGMRICWHWNGRAACAVGTLRAPPRRSNIEQAHPMQLHSTQASSRVLRVLVIDAHPRADALVSALAEAYARGARSAGTHAEMLALRVLSFDPDVRTRRPQDQGLEPDLMHALELIRSADHLVFAFPIFWGSMPSKLKAFLDRVMLPDVAFRERPGHEGYEGLLVGKTADLLTTMDTPPWVHRWIYHEPGITSLARSTLEFCGVRICRIRRWGPVNQSACTQRTAWLAQAAQDGASAEGRTRSKASRGRGRVSAWLAALRLQFYPMVWAAYLMGALYAAGTWSAIAIGPAMLGLILLFLLEAATVFVNDLYDFPSDRRNTHYGPFTGGSRVLVEGRLTPADLRQGALLALCAAASLAIAGHSLLSPAAWIVLVALAGLAIGYTLPPLALSWRTWGELDVALTNGVAPVILGWLLQGGSLASPTPWALALPIACSILPAILLASLPDREADAAAGKHTFAVRFGVTPAIRWAQGVVGIAWTAALMVWSACYGLSISLTTALLAAAIHGAALWRAAGRLRQRPIARRMDATLMLALSYIPWFVAFPLLVGPPATI